MDKPKKKAYLTKYLDPEIYGGGLHLSIICEVLQAADKDGVTELFVTPTEYETIKRWIGYSGQWNWDKKTFWGMTFIIID